MPVAAHASGIIMTGAMLGFPGEDYTFAAAIKATGGFGDPGSRPERINRLKWALDRTIALGLSDLSLHAGFIPEPGDPAPRRCSRRWLRPATWPPPRESPWL